MCKKLIVGVVTIIFTLILGRVEILDKPKENINSKAEEQNIVSKIEENVVEENLEIIENEIVTEVKEDVIVEKKTEEKQEIKDIAKEVVKFKEPKKEVSKTLQETPKTKAEDEVKQEQINASEENKQKVEEQEAPGEIKTAKEEHKMPKEEIRKEEIKVETKEKIEYNKDATQQLIDDIDEFAKRNSSLWDANGNKLYQIEKSESLVGQNYMSPYRKQQVAGVVLNVFPVKFLVYAIDIEKDGFTKETRYYIDVANY